MRHDVYAQFRHLLDFILSWRHHHRHIGVVILRPILAHLVVHPQRSCLVDRHHHRLALKTTSEEMLHDVLRHRIQPVVAGDEVILPSQFALQLFLSFIGELGILNQIVDIIVQIRIIEV